MKIHQTFRTTQEVIDAATDFCKKENRPISNLYETAVIDYLTARGQKIKKPSGKINFKNQKKRWHL